MAPSGSSAATPPKGTGGSVRLVVLMLNEDGLPRAGERKPGSCCPGAVVGSASYGLALDALAPGLGGDDQVTGFRGGGDLRQQVPERLGACCPPGEDAAVYEVHVQGVGEFGAPAGEAAIVTTATTSAP